MSIASEYPLEEYETGRGEKLADFVAGAGERSYPADVVEAAKVALVDYVGVAVGAVDEPAARATRAVAESWNCPGEALIFRGGGTNAALAALVNGTMAHCMDYDDTHIGGAGHIGAPCWSATLGLAMARSASEAEAISAFVTGYEVMAHLGTGGIRGVGRTMQQRGFHPTAVNGSVAAAAASAALLGLDKERSLRALSVGATCAGGLVASFGSDSKPFHAGKAAMEGILAAELAENGFASSPAVFERPKGLIDTFVQSGELEVPELDFSDDWELHKNGYKPFACCRATHASIQAAHQLTDKVAGRKIKRVTSKVHYNAPFTAGRPNPQSPLECKFSVQFCISAALCGYGLTAADFTETMVWDPRVRDILPTVELQPQREQPQFEAYVDVYMEDGEVLHAETHTFLGHPDNPMSLEQRHAKFLALTEPVLGQSDAKSLLDVLQGFDEAGALGEMRRLLAA